MNAQLLVNAYLAPILIPSIMGINVVKMLKNNSIDLLYVTISFGTIVGVISSILQQRLTRINSRSRFKLTMLTALLLTSSTLSSIIGFNFIRMNIGNATYILPKNIESKNLIVAPTGSDIFRYHFFADFIPGLLIILQTQLCSIVQFNLLYRAKRTFSIGEAAILSQLVSAAFSTWSFVTYSRLSHAGPFKVDLTTEMVLNIGALVFLTLFLPSYMFLRQMSRQTAQISRYISIMVSIILSYVRLDHLNKLTNKRDPIRWLVNYIFSSHHRISLFSIWLSTLAACISFSTTWTRMVGATNSLARKIFHLAIGIVFVTGYNQDIGFTRFASSGILIVMLMVEMIRAWQLRPFGAYLEQVCHSLRGKWDNRYLTLSHMYLLIGVFVPLWLLPGDSNITGGLQLSAGFIAVGVGDTAAALFGTFYGRTKFKGRSGKSLEGLIANILAMILCKLIWLGRAGFVEDFSFVIAAIMTGLVEAITNDCDNLILPLTMIFFLEIF